MFTLKEETKHIKIIHLEDDKITRRIVKDMIAIKCDDVELIQHECGISLGMDLGFERPDMLVVDWNLRDCCASDILMTLVRFKGPVVFLSSEYKPLIEECIIEFCGKVPDNFSILTKGDINTYKTLIKGIKSYAKEIDKVA